MPLPAICANEDEIRQQLADVQDREQRVSGAREVPLLLAVHADPERRDDDPGEQHAFPLVQQSEDRHRDVRDDAEHRNRIFQRLPLLIAQR